MVTICENSILPRATSTDPWSIQPGVVWELIARTKTASGHLYRGLPDGPGISQRAAAARTQRLWRWLVNCRKKNFMYEYHPSCYCARCKNKRQATSHKLQAKVASIKQLLTKLFYKII